jgi:hypothetical protein
MIRFEEMAYSAAIHAARMGERWQANAAGAHIPAPHTAASMLRSAWCKARPVRETVSCVPQRHPDPPSA